MVLSGLQPAALPAWMFHAQVPPPNFKFNPELPGITWVDLVFPFFLFAMGAAIPLAMASRTARGARWPELTWNFIRRGFWLGAFAIYVEHIRPWSFATGGVPTAGQFGTAILAFALLFPAMARLPAKWPAWVQEAVRFAGWGGMGLLMMSVRFPDGTRFSKDASDIIILILANVVVMTSAIWLLTRGNRAALCVALALLVGLRYVSAHDLPGAAALGWSPLPWLFRFGLAVPSIVAVMGLIIGSLLKDWLRNTDLTNDLGWGAARSGVAALLAFSLTPVVTAGLYARHLALTAGVSLVLVIALWALTARPGKPHERLCRRMLPWGTLFLLVGLLLEPYEGGIKKDPATLSYYFTTAGLATFLLITFTLLFEVFAGWRKALAHVTGAGANPMIAYVAGSNFVGPLLFLTGVNPAINRMLEGRSPWWGFAHAVIVTYVVAVVVTLFTRARIFLRT
jgi:predicted acyltransferase